MRCRTAIAVGLVAIALLCGFRGGLTAIVGLLNAPITVMNLGGGGNISGQSISAQGVRLVRGDVFGGYIFGTDNTWHLINGQSNMCPSGYPCPYFGFYPANTTDNQAYVGFTGLVELVGCPSVATCAYMYGGGWVFYSSTISASSPSSISWCHTNFTQTVANDITSNLAVGANNPGPFMAVDPFNPDHVIVGAQGATFGLFESFNATQACAGTDTWAAISTGSVPLATAYAGYIVAFDPTGPTTTCHSGSGTCASTVYVYTNGSPAGVYASFDGESTWHAISSSGSPPAAVHHMKVSAASAGGGNVWVADNSNALWEYNNASGTACSTGLGTCSWQHITSGTVTAQDITINPFNGNQVATASPSFKIFTSTNGAAASPTFTSNIGTLTAGDSPWAVKTQAALSTGINGIDFDPVNNGTLLGRGGQWEWTTTFPSGAFNYSVLSSGIQGAVSFGNIQVSASQTPTFGMEDIAGCTFTITTAATPPSGCALPSQGKNGLAYYSGLSVAPGTTFMASKASDDFSTGFDLSGYSTDGFKTNYLPYNRWNASVASGTGVSSGTAGVVRLNVGATAALNSFTPGDTLSRNSIVCVISTLFTSGLTQLCYPINVIDGSHIDLIGSTFNSGAMTTAGFSYTAYVPGNALDDWFGSGVVTNVTSTAGLVTVTYLNAGGGNTPNSSVICISNVVMTGASVVNGCWVPVNVNTSTKTAQLQGSTFVGGDTYSTGGTVLSPMAPGGGVAASTSTNIALYGADRTMAFCTTNGMDWNYINIAGVPAVVATVTGGPYPAGTTSITVSSGAALNGNKPVILLHSGRYLDETGSTFSGNTITNLINPVPLGDSIDNGAATYGVTASGVPSTGGPPAVFFRSAQIAADKVTPNTFYYINGVVGLVKWTNCGSTTIVATPTVPSFLNSAAQNDQLKAVPGQAGHLFYTAGSSGTNAGPHPANNLLWRTCNGVNNTANSVTVSQVTGFFEPRAVGFGAIAPGKSYPAIYVVGWYSPTNTKNTSTYGVWKSTDDANNGGTGACSGGNTWTEISGTSGFPAGFPGASIQDIEGDPFIYGPYYVLNSFGSFYGVQN
jgi:hypothetical protein